ncbi:TWiK family of potassium channels protein 7-like [Stegodyphus dumicola]|uniref:TWiK family of potassium channels protein 7-like n=1 Tax=Stegodyphus dumicola TaxID=202533 RepID=UPI0015ACEAE3|nr:TWiK family of potassium channels protein 7-like [Stegodyphus dumicola]
MPGHSSGVSKCSKCRRYCRLIATFLFSHIGLCALVVGYSIIGAFTFEALEAGHEKTKRQLMLKERENVVINLWALTSKSNVLSEHNWTTLATETLQDFEITLVKAVRKEGYDGKDESPLQWTFSGALLYSIIVITTIGECLNLFISLFLNI